MVYWSKKVAPEDGSLRATFILQFAFCCNFQFSICNVLLIRPAFNSPKHFFEDLIPKPATFRVRLYTA